MRKSARVASIIVIVAAAYTASVWYVGKRAQITIHDAVAQANERLSEAFGSDPDSGDVELAITQYQRHLFSSDVVYSLQVSDSNGQSTEYLLGDHLQHGPFPVAALTSGFFAPILVESRSRLLPSAATQRWFDSLDGQAPVTGSSRIGFDGGGKSSWEVSPLSITDDQQHLEFSGGSVHVQFSRDFTRSNSRGGFEALDYHDVAENERVMLQGVTFEGQMATDGDSKIVSTRSQFSARQLELVAQDAQALAFEQMALRIDGEQDGKMVNAMVHYDIERVSLSESDLGSLSVVMSANQVDTQALSELLHHYDAIYAQSGVLSRNDAALPVEHDAVLQEKLLAFLMSNPVLAIDSLVWRNDEGQSSTTLSVVLQRPDVPEATTVLDSLTHAIKSLNFEVDIAKPMFVRAYTQLLAQTVAPEVATGQAALLFDKLSARFKQVGLIGGDTDKAEGKISYEANEVNVNGTKMPLFQFIQRGFMALL